MNKPLDVIVARLDITENDWRTHISLKLEISAARLERLYEELASLGINSQLSCPCGRNELYDCAEPLCIRQTAI